MFFVLRLLKLHLFNAVTGHPHISTQRMHRMRHMQFCAIRPPIQMTTVRSNNPCSNGISLNSRRPSWQGVLCTSPPSYPWRLITLFKQFKLVGARLGASVEPSTKEAVTPWGLRLAWFHKKLLTDPMKADNFRTSPHSMRPSARPAAPRKPETKPPCSQAHCKSKSSECSRGRLARLLM